MQLDFSDLQVFRDVSLPDLDVTQAFSQCSSFQAEAKLLELSDPDIKNRENGDSVQINKFENGTLIDDRGYNRSSLNNRDKCNCRNQFDGCFALCPSLRSIASA